MNTFMAQNNVSMTFFTDLPAQNFFFTWECISTPWTVFLTQVHADNTYL